MAVLGMPSGPCRRPLGKLTRKGLEKILSAARKVHADAPGLYHPLERFFDVNVEERLNTPRFWEGLCYEDY
jgi:4-hydroxy-tetrahydrodipicolinate synthase